MEVEAGPSNYARAPFRGFSPPRWIIDLPSNYAEPPSIDTYHAANEKRNEWYAGQWTDGEEANYGPRLRRRGNVAFVKAKRTKPDLEEQQPEVNMGMKVKGLYESIVQGIKPTSTPKRPPRSPRKPLSSSQAPAPVDIDLTLDDSDEEPPVAPSPTEPEPEPELESDDDDLIIINPLTRQPYPRPRKYQPRAIHQLLSDSAANSKEGTPVTPPISYGFSSDSFGYRLLAKHGWKEGQGLGAQPEPGQEGRGEGIKVPLEPSNKFDKSGLGAGWGGKSGKVRKREAMERKRAKEKIELEERGKGAYAMAQKAEQEGRERRAMIAYMNR